MINSMKKNIIPIVFLAISIIFVAFDWLKFDLVLKTIGLVVNALTLLIYGLYGLMGIETIIYLRSMFPSLRWRAIIPMITFIVTILYVFILPYTSLYQRINVSMNYENRRKVIEMVENQQIDSYKIGPEKYIAPYRFTSHTGTIHIRKTDGITRVAFYIHKGFFWKELIYLSDDSGVDLANFKYGLLIDMHNFDRIEKIDTCWYSTTTVRPSNS